MACLSTPALEFLHCMIKLLQEPALLFKKPARGFSSPHSEVFRPVESNANPWFWNADSMLAILKPKLFQFFQTAYRLAANGALSE